MSRDEAPLSTHAADQTWFSMLLVNDPNTALVASLRPSRQHPLWAALRRPFERLAPHRVLDASEIPGLRPRRAPWIAAGLLLGLAVTGAASSSRLSLSAGSALLSSTTPAATWQHATAATTQPAPASARALIAESPERLATRVQVPPIAGSVLTTKLAALRPSAQAPATSPVEPRATPAVPSAAPAKQKKSAKNARRSLPRALRQALTGRRSTAH